MNDDLPLPEVHEEHPHSHAHHHKGFFENIGPKNAYWLGVGTALALVFAVGFFMLLNLYLKGDGKFNAKGSNTPPAIVNNGAPVDPSQPPTPANIQIAPVSDQDHIRGPKNAKVALIEFSDTECPFCKRFHESMKQVLSTYPNDVSWVYRHFPLDSLHLKARKEAEATECAAELGGNDGFWKYLDRMMEVTPSNDGLDLAELPKIAQFVGLNQAKFTECLASGKFAQKIQEHEAQGVAAGANGTPYSVILVGDQKIPVNGAVPFEQLKAMIDSVLKN